MGLLHAPRTLSLHRITLLYKKANSMIEPAVTINQAGNIRYIA